MKLTNDIRQSIVDKAISRSKIPGRRETFKKKHKAFGNSVYTRLVVPTIPQAIFTAWDAAGGEGRAELRAWIYTTMEISVADAPGMHNYRGYTDEEGIFGSNSEVVKSSFSFDDLMLCNKSTLHIAGDEFLLGMAKDLVAYHQKTNAIEIKLRRELSGVLHSVTTTDKLFDLWPEAKELVPSNLTPAGALIPTEAIASINKALNSESDE